MLQISVAGHCGPSVWKFLVEIFNSSFLSVCNIKSQDKFLTNKVIHIEDIIMKKQKEERKTQFCLTGQCETMTTEN